MLPGFCRLGIERQHSWVALAQGSAIWRFGWAGGVVSKLACLHGCWQEALLPRHVDLALSVLRTQLASSRAMIPENKAEAAVLLWLVLGSLPPAFGSLPPACGSPPPALGSHPPAHRKSPTCPWKSPICPWKSHLLVKSHTCHFCYILFVSSELLRGEFGFYPLKRSIVNNLWT